MAVKKKKTGLRISAVALLCVIAVFSAVILLYWNELRSLLSLKKVDDYPMYQMTYYGDYGFDDFLKTGASSDSDIEAFVTKRLLKGLPIDLGITGAGCTAFVTRNHAGEIIYGRNFDFLYAPSLQLYTRPDNGYASVSTVNLAFAGYSEEKLPHERGLDSFLTLAAPYLPFDGMNEKGVAIALLAVPEAHPAYDPKRVTLNTTTMIRLVLDKAASVDEAIELMRQYNIFFSGDVTCHYLIADASGRSVLAEYYDDDLQVVEWDRPYQVASNFIEYNGLHIGEGFTEFERFDAAVEAIEANGQMLDEAAAIDLLAEIGVYDGKLDKLQWTAVYNLTTGDGQIFAHRKKDHSIRFHLDIIK